MDRLRRDFRRVDRRLQLLRVDGRVDGRAGAGLSGAAGLRDRLFREAGGVGAYDDFRYSDACVKVHRAVLGELSGPAVRKGLLVGFLPVLAVGLLMGFTGRRR